MKSTYKFRVDKRGEYFRRRSIFYEMGHRHRADKYYTTDLVNKECIMEWNEEWKMKLFSSPRI